MHKLAAIGLAALLASTGAAFAKSRTISLDGLCDTMTFTYELSNNAYGVMHLAGCAALRQPSSNPIPGVGIVVKRPPGSSTARFMMVGETQPDGKGAPVGMTYVIDFPLVTGGTWIVYSSSDGKAVTQTGGGSYTVH